uniref:Group 1 truncated hemoglobin n=1 Tax=Eutreptiella gymnastica TaxID=73025 RepID=A0A7S1I8J3_9EUGL
MNQFYGLQDHTTATSAPPHSLLKAMALGAVAGALVVHGLGSASPSQLFATAVRPNPLMRSAPHAIPTFGPLVRSPYTAAYPIPSVQSLRSTDDDSLFEPGHHAHKPLMPDSEEEKAREETLLARIGGEPALEAAVDRFYERLTENPKTEHWFHGIDMLTLKAHQRDFMRLAFTGIPPGVDVAGLLTTKHERLAAMGLDGNDFDNVATELVGTLQDLSVPENLINEVVATVGPLRVVFEDMAKAQAKTA